MFRLATKFSNSTGALTARSWRPASDMEWQLARPDSFWGRDDVSILSATWSRRPEIGVEIPRPDRLPFGNAWLAPNLPRGLASSAPLAAYARLRASSHRLHALGWSGPRRLTTKLPMLPLPLLLFKFMQRTGCRQLPDINDRARIWRGSR